MYLLSPIIKTFDDDIPSNMDELRLIGIIDDPTRKQNSKDVINYYYYKNLNRIILPTEKQIEKITNYLNLDEDKKDEWFLNWPKDINLLESDKAKESIGINFCYTNKEIDVNLPNGYIPVLELDYLNKLGDYNYVSDILEAYELAKLFKIRTFNSKTEAKAWGLFQLQAIRMQYVHFEYSFKNDIEKPLPELTQDYIGGMNEIELVNHFNKFKVKNAKIIEQEEYQELIKIVKIESQ